MSRMVSLPAQEFGAFLKAVSSFIEMSKEASAAPTITHSRIDTVVDTLCAEGLIPTEKRAATADALRADPNKLCDLLEKLAKKTGPSSLGEGDVYNNDGGDASLAFAEFCVR